MMALALTVAVPTRAQSIVPLAAKAKQVHWNRYINKQYGLSFRYPSTFVPTGANGRCNSSGHRPCLLALRRRNTEDGDRSDASIWVIMWADEPIHFIPGSGNMMPTPAKIGTHTFHKGIMGSSGVGITDYYEYNLKNRALVFQFGPDEHGEPSDETKAVEPKLLASFRTF